VAAGSTHGQFLKSDGSLWSMGNNSNGQLGDTATTNRSTPVQVATGVISVAAGAYHSLFVKTDGSLWATGNNSSNQLGDGTTTGRYTPVQVASNVSAASAGGAHSLWLTSTPGSSTTAIGNHPASAIAALNSSVSLSVTAVGSGSLDYQWYSGLTGDISQPVVGATSPDFTTPPVTSAAVFWVRVTGASNFANSRAAWITVLEVPAIVTQPVVSGTLPEGGVRLSVAGSAATVSYQWFTGTPGDISHPLPGATSTTIVTLPIRSTSSFWVRLGNPSGTVDSAAVIVSKAPVAGRYLKTAGSSYGSSLTQRDGSVASATTGSSHCLFVKTSGTLWAMGSNSSGQFGNASTSSSSTPVRIAENVAAAAAGASHSLFVKTDGTLWAMGSNSFGQLGDGTTSGRTTPVLIARDVASVAAGFNHSLFVKTDGSLWAMGANSGKLGDGTYMSRSAPVPISTSVVMAAAGRDHSLFVKADGSLWGMGVDFPFGQLGIGTSSSFRTPVRIADGVVAISAGAYHSLFVTADGTLRSMGRNNYGQLGYGATDSDWSNSGSFFHSNGTPPPPRIVAANVAMATAGTSHSLWTSADSSLWSSGANSNGQLCASGASTLKPPAKVQDRTGHAAAGGDNSVILTTNAAVEPPAIVIHPVSTIIASGNAATFGVTATGEAPLVYQWYLGPTGDTNQPIAGATSDSYTLSSLSSGTEVWVRVSNSAAYSESRSATVVTGIATSAYQEWAATQGLSGSDIAPSADPDGDLRNNLLEYATGSAAGRADNSSPAAVVMDANIGQAAFHLQLRGDPGLRLTCLLTSDFTSWQVVPLEFSGGTWSSGNPLLEITDATPGEENLWNLTLRHPTAPPRLFMKTAAEMVPAN
jgi:alpha-tubulin suppressor-like RCC1 family protein